MRILLTLIYCNYPLIIITMKATDWQNTAKFVQQVQRNAALADPNQLSSLPLSELSLDSSGPP